MKFYARTAGIAIDASPLMGQIGLRLAQLSGVVALIAFISFRLARTTINPLDPSRASTLVTQGIFRFTRNPMYLSLLMLLIAYALRLGAWMTWLGPLVFVAYVTRFQIIPEEKILTVKFGGDFLAYKTRTRRWI